MLGKGTSVSLCRYPLPTSGISGKGGRADLLNHILEGECRKLPGKSLFIVIRYRLKFSFAKVHPSAWSIGTNLGCIWTSSKDDTRGECLSIHKLIV
jgi:hypothetical protein